MQISIHHVFCGPWRATSCALKMNLDLQKQSSYYVGVKWNLEWINANAPQDHTLKKMYRQNPSNKIL
jgi:hypothetical protein